MLKIRVKSSISLVNQGQVMFHVCCLWDMFTFLHLSLQSASSFVRWSFLWGRTRFFVNTTLPHPVPAEVMILPPAAAQPAATMILHLPSPAQQPLFLVCLHLHPSISTPLANCGPWECLHHPLHPAWQKLQVTHQELCRGSRRRQLWRVLWRIHPWGPSWGRSRPLKRWTTLPELGGY